MAGAVQGALELGFNVGDYKKNILEGADRVGFSEGRQGRQRDVDREYLMPMVE